jgi:hypothetical protein
MNFVLTKLTEFDNRISKLETGSSAGQVQITGFDPPVQQNAGRNLSVMGSNFVTPATVNIVKLNDTQITSFTSPNNDKILNFVIPNSFVPPPDGNVTVSVSNSKGSTSVLYKVLPFVQVVGPDPVITQVLPVSPAVLILVNHPIHIVGGNFAPTSAGDHILFDVTASDGSNVTYPKAGSSLTFDSGGTSDPNNIFVTLPDMAEINIPGPAGEMPVTLRLIVGAHPEQRFQLLARRS